MGKMFIFLIILIFLEIILLATGQIQGTLSSQIFEAIENPEQLRDGKWWLGLIGLNSDNDEEGGLGLGSLLVGIGVTVGFLVTKSDTILYIPIALALGLLATDFITIFADLLKASPVLAIFVLVPVMIMYAFIVAEWARGKD